MGRAVDLHRQAHQAFVARDFDGVKKLLKDDFIYADHPRGLTLTSSSQFVGWLQGWVTGFSDGRPDEPRYTDGGDRSVRLFQALGLKDEFT